MRVIVLLLALALAAGHLVNVPPEFEMSKTYVYKYEGLLLGGLPMEGLAKAGVKVNSKVLISPVQNNVLLLKLQDPQLFKYSGVWPKDPLVPATKLTAALASQLLIPIKFEYTKGVVGKVFAPAEVSTAVLNLHRGILNLLQLDLKPTDYAYELQEAGVQGVCKTNYNIRQDYRIAVTKYKDLTNCETRIVKDFGMAYLETLQSQSLSGAATYHHLLTPGDTGALLTDAIVNEFYHVSPGARMDGVAQMEAEQILKLLHIEKTPIAPIQTEYLFRGLLSYEFATEIIQTPLQFLRFNNTQNQAVEIVNNLVANNAGKVNLDAPLKFIQLIQVLRLATPEDVEDIWKQFRSRPEHRRWILDTISAIGTPTAVRFIKEMFLTGEITVAETVHMFVMAVHMVPADVGVVTLFGSFALNEKVQQNTILRNLAMLGYGSMISKYCNAVPTCSAALLKAVHDLAAKAIESTDVQDIYLLLKVMGNAGHISSLKPIMKILPGTGSAAAAFPIRVHIDALLALRTIAKKEPTMIQSVVVPLLEDQTLNPEVRMMAAVVVFETRPSVGLLSNIVHSLEKETSMQVFSFVYSYIRSLTRSTAPDLAYVAGARNLIKRRLSRKLEKLSYRYSKAIYLDMFTSPAMAGVAGTAFVINDAASLLPRAVLAKARSYVAGTAADLFEVVVRTEGLQEALLKAPASENQENDRITKMLNIMKAIHDWKALPDSQPLASAYVKFLGQEIAFVNIDKAVIDQAIQLASTDDTKTMLKNAVNALNSGVETHFFKPLLAAEMRYIFPTALGLAMELSGFCAGVASANIKVRVRSTALDDWANFLNPVQLLNAEMNIEAEVMPSMAMHTYAVMGVNSAFLQASVMGRATVVTTVPAKMAVTADMKNLNLKIKALPVATPKHVAVARFETLAVARDTEESEKITTIVPVTATQHDSAEIQPLNLATSTASAADQPNFHQTFCVIHEILGIKGCAELKSTTAALSKTMTLLNIVGKHSAHISLTPANGSAVERLEFEVQVGPKSAEKILKEINIIDEDSTQGRVILSKLKEILEPTVNQRSSKPFGHNFFGLEDPSPDWFGSSSVSSSGSSRMSSSSPPQTSEELTTFRTFHKNKHMTSGEKLKRMIIGDSFEIMIRENKFLGNALKPVVVATMRAVRSDNVLVGYQATTYLDKANWRLQTIMSALAVGDNRMICADSVVLSKNKVRSNIAWGEECLEYVTTLKAEAGIYGAARAARVEFEWLRLPTYVTSYETRLSKYIRHAALMAGIRAANRNNNKKKIEVIFALPKERTVDLFVKLPRLTLSKPAIPLPVPWITAEDGTIHENPNIIKQLNHLYGHLTSVQCSLVHNKLKMFNNVEFNFEMPPSCYHLLVQDCSSALSFVVLVKEDRLTKQKEMTVKIDNWDVDLYLSDNDVLVKINGREFPIGSLPYENPSGTVNIREFPNGLALHAPRLGLQEVYFSKDKLSVKVVGWMRGKACGLCGKADGAARHQHYVPNGFQAASPAAFAQSWVLTGESSPEARECRMTHATLENVLIGKTYRCRTAYPTLHCLPGCVTVRSVPLIVDYYCTFLTEEDVSDIQRYKQLKATAKAIIDCACPHDESANPAIY